MILWDNRDIGTMLYNSMEHWRQQTSSSLLSRVPYIGIMGQSGQTLKLKEMIEVF